MLLIFESAEAAFVEGAELTLVDRESNRQVPTAVSLLCYAELAGSMTRVLACRCLETLVL